SPIMTTAPTPFRASDHSSDKKLHLLLAATGSVATIKIPLIAKSLLTTHNNCKKDSISIRILLTPSACKFLNGASEEQPTVSSLRDIEGVEGVYTDGDEWGGDGEEEGEEQGWGWKRDKPILHIELRKWADVMLVAPLSANSLAGMVGGRAEGVVGSVLRAWDTTGRVDGVRWRDGGVLGLGGAIGKERVKRVFVAPAMNTAMWLHPVTGGQMRVLREEWGVKGGEGEGEGKGWVTVLEPMEKGLACGDVGVGAMMDWREIVRVIEEYAGLNGGK
ncbi:hypothetical protein FQN54_004722, partial [Arachnomyces sp. PD_36]